MCQLHVQLVHALQSTRLVSLKQAVSLPYLPFLLLQAYPLRGATDVVELAQAEACVHEDLQNSQAGCIAPHHPIG